MRRRISQAGAMLFAVVLIAVAAAPASAQVPGGQGLVSFGTVTCEGLGEVTAFGPRGQFADTAFTTTGQHVVQTNIDITFTDVEGNVDTFSKSYGQKAGLTTFTCTQHFEEPGEGTGDITVTVALVPPQ
jgi:hypothetical protein